MASYYREIVDLLKNNGWSLHRQGKGSHEVWVNSVTGVKLTVPQNCKKKHTANAIMKQTGLSKKF